MRYVTYLLMQLLNKSSAVAELAAQRYKTRMAWVSFGGNITGEAPVHLQESYDIVCT